MMDHRIAALEQIFKYYLFNILGSDLSKKKYKENITSFIVDQYKIGTNAEVT